MAGGLFPDPGDDLAEMQITFRLPILWGDPLQVGVAVTRVGNKSFTMTYCLEDAQDGRLFASASSVQVAYDYTAKQTIPVPEDWRAAILNFEGLVNDISSPT